MQENKIKYYTDSKGVKTPLNNLHTEHIINAISKKQREIFLTKNKDEYFKKVNEINDLKEEMYKRINVFGEKLGE